MAGEQRLTKTIERVLSSALAAQFAVGLIWQLKASESAAAGGLLGYAGSLSERGGQVQRVVESGRGAVLLAELCEYYGGRGGGGWESVVVSSLFRAQPFRACAMNAADWAQMLRRRYFLLYSALDDVQHEKYRPM